MINFHGKTSNLNPLSPYGFKWTNIEICTVTLSWKYINFLIIAFAIQFFSIEEKSVSFPL